MMAFRPPIMPWPIVGARTVIPRTSPLYSRIRRFWMSKVVDTSMDDWIAIAVSLSCQFAPQRRQGVVVRVHDALFERNNGVVRDRDRLRSDFRTALCDVAVGDAAFGLQEVSPFLDVQGVRLVRRGAYPKCS